MLDTLEHYLIRGLNCPVKYMLVLANHILTVGIP